MGCLYYQLQPPTHDLSTVLPAPSALLGPWLIRADRRGREKKPKHGAASVLWTQLCALLPKFICRKPYVPHPQWEVTRFRWGHDDGTSVMGAMTYKKRCRIHGDTELGLPSSRTVRNKYPLFKPSPHPRICGILLCAPPTPRAD